MTVSRFWQARKTGVLGEKASEIGWNSPHIRPRGLDQGGTRVAEVEGAVNNCLDILTEVNYDSSNVGTQ